MPLSDGIGRHTPSQLGVKVARLVWLPYELHEHVGDAIAQLTREQEWVTVGLPVPDVTDAVQEALDVYYSPSLVGMCAPFAGSPGDGWLALDGSTYDAADYPELAAACPDFVAGGSLVLPDLRGRVALGAGGAYALGAAGGQEEVTLTIDEIPSHDHDYTPPVPNVDIEAPGAPDIVAAGLGPTTSTGAAGGGQAHDNMPPYTVLTWAIFAGRV